MAEAQKTLELIENYIYLYHTDSLIVLPGYPESVMDQLPVDFKWQTPLARTAPIYSYSSSGPRSLQVSLTLHRDMMWQVNYNVSNLKVTIDEDYVDVAIKQLQAASLPRYNSGTKLVDPPLVAVRLGDDIFIKGVITGSLTETYQTPILRSGKYAIVIISFNVYEVDPYDAAMAQEQGSFRCLNTSLERNLWKRG